MGDPVFVDIETQSLVDLRTDGARRYIVHPSTRLMCLVARHKGCNYAWLPAAPAVSSHDYEELVVGPYVPLWLRAWVSSGLTFVGHNALNFDGPFLCHHYNLTPRWYDTMFGARASGLPGSLDAAGAALGFGGKDQDGKQVMRMLCAAKVKGGQVVYPVGTPALWGKLLHYNLQDVLITERLYEECRGREEPEVVRTHEAINSRGIKIDTDWLKSLLDMWHAVESLGGDTLSELTGGALTRENAASVPQVKAWLQSQGVRMSSVARKELDLMYEDPEGYFRSASDNVTVTGQIDVDLVVEVLLLRQQLTRAMKGKLERIATSLDDDHRVRDWAVYYGAHTGRWTGRGLQPQNLSKGVDIDVEAIFKGPRTVESVEEAVEAYNAKPEHRTHPIRADDVLVSLVRPVFAAARGCDLSIVDYNAVEARCAAWLAGEEWMLDCFEDPKRDIYCEYWQRVTGEAIGKKDPKRQVAKICVLGLQYGMSHRKLGAFAKRSGIDLPALGLTPEGLVKDYRTVCPAIARMWRGTDRALRQARTEGQATCCNGRVLYTGTGSEHLHCHLSSGRVITYRNCRIERGVPGYCRILGLPPFEADMIRYRTPKGFDTDLYGTKAFENICQAICRDLLASAMVGLESIHPAVLHVHDEIVSEVPRDRAEECLHEMCRIMSIAPRWAAGFPLKVEGYTCSNYVKAPWSDSHRAEWMNGRKL